MLATFPLKILYHSIPCLSNPIPADPRGAAYGRAEWGLTTDLGASGTPAGQSPAFISFEQNFHSRISILSFLALYFSTGNCVPPRMYLICLSNLVFGCPTLPFLQGFHAKATLLHLPSDCLTTCPADAHFRLLCPSTQVVTCTLDASFFAVLVALWIQSTQGSNSSQSSVVLLSEVVSLEVVLSDS